MPEDDLTAEWGAFASEWIARAEEGRDSAREGLLDARMLELVGDVAGLRVIDLGCGEGRFCRMLAARGAETSGVDLQPAFIAYADGRKGDRETYRVGDMTRLDDVAADAFDLAVSYITLVDVPDQRAAVEEAFRVLRPGGRFLVCNISPMASAWPTVHAWHRSDDGELQHLKVDRYADEGPRRVAFRSGHEVTNFHRMLSTTVNDFLDVGFVLGRIDEPIPTEAQVARFPENAVLARIPCFTIYDLTKPA